MQCSYCKGDKDNAIYFHVENPAYVGYFYVGVICEPKVNRLLPLPVMLSQSGYGANKLDFSRTGGVLWQVFLMLRSIF